MNLGVGIIGCGLIGRKRAQSLGNGKLIACVDSVQENAIALAKIYNAKALNNYKELLEMSDIDLIIIATRNDSLAELTLAAIEAGKHILVKKPAARFSEELLPVIESAKRNRVKVRVGFNHRYHREFRKTRLLVDSGELGELMFIRARYGHGGRQNYNKEWRANPNFSGGGELIDQGPHLIDLSRWFLGNFTEIQGFVHTYYGDMPVDDNGFMLLKTSEQQAAFLHVSCTEWKNLFSMKIYGKNAKITHFRIRWKLWP